MGNSRLMRPRSASYADDWIDYVFTIWYRNGKPQATTLLQMIDPPPNDTKPTPLLIKKMIRDLFVPRALELDTEAAEIMEAELIQEKVEMFRRHTEIAVEIQNTALEYLRAEGAIKDAPSALKALFTAMDIEKQSRGIDKVLQSVGTKTDEQLFEELRKIISASSSVVLLEDSDNASE